MRLTNPYLYQLLSARTPDLLLESNGYPIKNRCGLSQGSSWIVFHGRKITVLERVFYPYLITLPPAYFGGKNKDFTWDEIRAIKRTRGATEATGFIRLVD